MQKTEILNTEHNDFYGKYIDLVPENTELITGYIDDKNKVIDFFNSITEQKFEYRYQPKKWSIKEVLQHMIDNERIFTIRMLRIARNDNTSLPGYDQDVLITTSGAHQKTKTQLIEEFIITRDFSISIVKSLNQTGLKNIGTVSNSLISARACAFLNIGHGNWHINTIKERYL